MYPGQSGQLSTPNIGGPVASSGGPDGHQLTQPVNGHLDYVSQLSRQLGVNDPVESYLTPVVGKWSDLHAEATRWRTAASTATQVTQSLSSPLGGLDAAWQGPAADSFLDYMHSVGLAGNDLADAMTAMADALDKTADGLRQIVNEMVGVLADTAEQASDAMSVPVGGEDRARQFLAEVDQPSSQLYESVRTVLSAFVQMCDGAAQGGSTMKLAHTMPAQNWTPPAAAPATPPTPVPTGQPSSAAPAWPTQQQAAQAAQPVPPAQPAGPASPATVAAAAAAGGGQHAAAAVGTAHLGGGAATSIPDGASAAAAQHQGTPAVSGVSAPDTASSASAGAAAPAGVAAGAAGGESSGGTSMMGGMGGMRGGGGQDYEHKSKIRLNSDPKAVFGKVDRTAPPVIGEE